MSMLRCVPDSVRPAPAFVGLNFRGNHTLLPITDIPVVNGWGAYGAPDTGLIGQLPSEWCIRSALRRGWAVCTAFYGELEPDRHADDHDTLSRRWRSAGHQAGSLRTWAWLISRLADALIADPRIDATRLIAVGHSRLGKAALVAAAHDQRFAGVVANGSGCGGAAPLRQPSPGAETLRDILRFRHWFHPRLMPDADPTSMPVDVQHLLACVAPRPVLLTNAEDDEWADPAGQHRALCAALPLWRLLGSPAELAASPPPVDGLPHGSITAHSMRLGPHQLGTADWAAIHRWAATLWR
jgi:hypothetical protein